MQEEPAGESQTKKVRHAKGRIKQKVKRRRNDLTFYIPLACPEPAEGLNVTAFQDTP
jgi:hypothetical protein